MTFADEIAALADCQAQLIAALDKQDAAAIEESCSALAAATGRLRSYGAVHASDDTLRKFNYALRQNDAAKTRLAFLAGRNRQKIDALGALRSGESAHRYKRP